MHGNGDLEGLVAEVLRAMAGLDNREERAWLREEVEEGLRANERVAMEVEVLEDRDGIGSAQLRVTGERPSDRPLAIAGVRRADGTDRNALFSSPLRAVSYFASEQLLLFRHRPPREVLCALHARLTRLAIDASRGAARIAAELDQVTVQSNGPGGQSIECLYSLPGAPRGSEKRFFASCSEGYEGHRGSCVCLTARIDLAARPGHRSADLPWEDAQAKEVWLEALGRAVAGSARLTGAASPRPHDIATHVSPRRPDAVLISIDRGGPREPPPEVRRSITLIGYRDPTPGTAGAMPLRWVALEEDSSLERIRRNGFQSIRSPAYVLDVSLIAWDRNSGGSPLAGAWAEARSRRGEAEASEQANLFLAHEGLPVAGSFGEDLVAAESLARLDGALGRGVGGGVAVVAHSREVKACACALGLRPPGEDLLGGLVRGALDQLRLGLREGEEVDGGPRDTTSGEGLGCEEVRACYGHILASASAMGARAGNLALLTLGNAARAAVGTGRAA